MAAGPAVRAAPSIRAIAAVFVVIPVAVVSAVLVTLLSASNRRSGEALGDAIVEHASAMAVDDVRGYLGSAVRLSDLYSRRLADGGLSADDLPAWERPMLQDLAVWPDVASICFGTPDGRAVYLQEAHGRLEFGLGSGPGPEECVEHEIFANGTRGAEPLRVYQYDPTARPWYTAALDAPAPAWTPVYFWFATSGGDAETGAGYARRIHGPDGTLRGVLTIDVTLSAISEFLRRIPIGEGGHLFLVDSEGMLIAGTDGPVTSPEGSRLIPADASGAAARAIAPVTGGAAGDVPARASHAGRIRLESGPARAAVTPLRPYPGIDWRLVAVIPESAFMGEARSAQRRSLLIALVAVVGAGLLALRFADRLVHPIVALRTHMRRLARGEFEVPLDLHAARELQELSSDLNAAALDLKSHVEIRHSLELAMQVQQSLLPSEPPRPPGLDLAGKSTYCDETGGDYFDFIDVGSPGAAPGDGGPGSTRAAERRTLVVVGDVMGHGVAAALLMATARATLRLRARRPASLGRILTDVNDVLAPDFRDGRFMTMAMMSIDPAARRAWWASAGHEAPIVYEPGRDAFRTLEGGDFPLGVVAGVEYREYEIAGLDPGAVLAIGTDGIWEATDDAGRAFGHERLREIIRSGAGLPASEIAARIDGALREFLGAGRARDDVTYVIARLVPEG